MLNILIANSMRCFVESCHGVSSQSTSWSRLAAANVQSKRAAHKWGDTHLRRFSHCHSVGVLNSNGQDLAMEVEEHYYWAAATTIATRVIQSKCELCYRTLIRPAGQ